MSERFVQRSHGRPRPQVPRADSLTAGTAAALRSDAAEIRRTPGGTVADGDAARALGALGHAAQKGKCRLAARFALGESFADPRFEPYARAGRAYRRAQVSEVARYVGGGTCGLAASSVIGTAALQLAGSRFASEVLGDLALASRLGDASRANLLSAFELAAREAAARKAASPPDWRRLLELPEAPAPSMPAKHAHAPADGVSGPPPASGTPDDETRSTGQPACSTATGGKGGQP